LLPEDVLPAEVPPALALAPPELPWPAALPSGPAAAPLGALEDPLPLEEGPLAGGPPALAPALTELPWLAALDEPLLPKALPLPAAAPLPPAAGAAGPSMSLKDFPSAACAAAAAPGAWLASAALGAWPASAAPGARLASAAPGAWPASTAPGARLASAAPGAWPASAAPGRIEPVTPAVTSDVLSSPEPRPPLTSGGCAFVVWSDEGREATGAGLGAPDAPGLVLAGVAAVAGAAAVPDGAGDALGAVVDIAARGVSGSSWIEVLAYFGAEDGACRIGARTGSMAIHAVCMTRRGRFGGAPGGSVAPARKNAAEATAAKP
jgi:hypothetical protein